MKQRKINRFGKAFGPSGSFAGLVLFVSGIGMSFFYLPAIFVVIIGAFLAFTHASATIDTENGRVRLANHLFGCIRIGRWHSIENNMLLSLIPNKELYRTYSRSNRRTEIKTHQYKLVLNTKDNSRIIPLKNFISKEKGLEEMKSLAAELNITYQL